MKTFNDLEFEIQIESEFDFDCGWNEFDNHVEFSLKTLDPIYLVGEVC